MTKRINLALQGGGAHGAFTWGALDRLLDEPDIEIAAISGTSAGALNAAALKGGLLENGREGAKAALSKLWRQVGAIEDPAVNDWMQMLWPDPTILSQAIESSLGYVVGDTVSRMVSPYSYGPLYQNPLNQIVGAFAYDFVCADLEPRLFIAATNVRTGKIKVFQGEEITQEAIMASACLPTLFKAVEIDDPATGRREAYWDGGYAGNPALFPLYRPTLPDDVLIININPLVRDELPVTGPQILNRINEISFNASLLRELRAISFVHRLIKDGKLERGSMKDVHVHMVADDALMTELSVATKTVPAPPVLSRLREAGWAAMDAFLGAHKEDLNERSSLDLPAMYDS
ncbi:MAG: patatin-like phospholipase family protein [Rhodobacteraceae bacterium]|nr:patatin-like phospholipase family protein [Paracoccaceae bacterium]